MATKQRLQRAAVAMGALVFGTLALCPRSDALNPALEVSQYAHTAWKMRDGFVKGPIEAIVQTPDGYLWLGTDYGLLRFDGVRAVPWQPPPNQSLPSTYITGLLASRDGTLWIGTLKGLASWKDGKLTLYPEVGDQMVPRIVEDQEGTIWASEWAFPPPGKLCAIEHGRVKCYGEDGSLGRGVTGLFVDRKGSLWVGVQDGIWRWKPGPPQFFSLPGNRDAIQCIGEDAEGTLLVGWKEGLYELAEGNPKPYSLAGSVPKFAGYSFVRDRDGSIWIPTTRQGVVHIRQRRVDTFAMADGLSSEGASTIFEDREGNIWAGTLAGLDRFRDFAVATFSVKQGLSGSYVGSVVADPDGSVWIGSYSGLNRVKNGRVTIAETGSAKRDGKINGHNPQSIFQDSRGRVWISTIKEFGHLEDGRFISERGVPGGDTTAIVGDALQNLWVSNPEKGLFRISARSEVKQVSWAELGHKDGAAALAVDPSRGGLWLGFLRGGIAYWDNGQIKASYGVNDGLGQGVVSRFRFDPDGTVWIGTGGGLSRLKNGRIATLTSRNGLPCDYVRWVIQGNDRSFWLSMPCGLVRILRKEIDAWAAAIDKNGDATKPVQVAVFDNFDGVQVTADTVGYSPRVARTLDGKLWFPAEDGVSVIDPSHLPFNKTAPPVHVEQVIADHKVYAVSSSASGNLPLPALTRDLQFDYTALSLVVPEKIQFKYKLEGWDHDWQDAGNRRQAFYNGLTPRHYRFRVAASNNSGVWSESDAVMDFSIAPAFYQALWFQGLCVLGLAGIVWSIYSVRVRHVAALYKGRMEERLEERERIARELHDTFLQSVQGLVLKFDAVSKQIPCEQPARKAMENALDLADAVLLEGRSRVRNLRDGCESISDLPAALRRVAEEMPENHQTEFKAVVEGNARELHPMVLEEAYCIGREALMNALSHSGGLHIEAEITYDARQFRLRIRDDGRGIDPAILEHGGRTGHWGLQGMRERAERVGGQLEFWSRPGTGTEVELRVPGGTAYRAGGTPSKRTWFARALDREKTS